jgi:hypothetical protein
MAAVVRVFAADRPLVVVEALFHDVQGEECDRQGLEMDHSAVHTTQLEDRVGLVQVLFGVLRRNKWEELKAWE